MVREQVVSVEDRDTAFDRYDEPSLGPARTGLDGHRDGIDRFGPTKLQLIDDSRALRHGTEKEGVVDQPLLVGPDCSIRMYECNGVRCDDAALQEFAGWIEHG